jgi:hemoglobin
VSDKDIENRADIDLIVCDFYEQVLSDPIIGFIFTDIAKIDLELHLPLIGDFWFDMILGSKESELAKRYRGNALRSHLELNSLIDLKPGHFTRWLYLFTNSVDRHFQGSNAEQMKKRAVMVAQSISAAIMSNKKGDMNLVLPN